MKKTLLLLLTTAILLSCKKEENDKLNGNWTCNSIKVVYYDASNKAVFAESQNFVTNWSFDDNNVTLTIPSTSDKVVSSYTISNGTITFSNKDIGTVQSYRIDSNDGKTMQWSAESTDPDDVTYVDNGLKSAAKAGVSLTLTKN